jgi:hypothetical protein
VGYRRRKRQYNQQSNDSFSDHISHLDLLSLVSSAARKNRPWQTAQAYAFASIISPLALFFVIILHTLVDVNRCPQTRYENSLIVQRKANRCIRMPIPGSKDGIPVNTMEDAQ